MKTLIIALIAIIVIGGAGYLILRKPESNMGASKTIHAPAVNNAVLITKTDSNLGQYLADPSGKPLYVHTDDSLGVSSCTGSCLAIWPPYVDKGSTSDLPAGVSTIKRTDTGQIQFTYGDMPLYYFGRDSGVHSIGNGMPGFTLAKPLATTSSQPRTMPSTSPSSSSNANVPADGSSSSGYPY